MPAGKAPPVGKGPPLVLTVVLNSGLGLGALVLRLDETLATADAPGWWPRPSARSDGGESACAFA